jgi:hypothetical protein
MLRHVVLFRWKAEASEDDKRQVRDGLADLPGAIPEIRAYRYGDDAALAEGNFDFAVVADFDDADAYRVYAGHPAHTGLIAERIRPIVAERVAVPYETS